MDRRKFVAGTAASISGMVLPSLSEAQFQDWPSRPVKIVVPSVPGGSLDILSRLFGRGMGERLGQQFLVENRAGGGGNIAFDAVAKSRPDGYTIMIASDPLAVNPAMFSNLAFDPLRDFAPIIMIATLSQVLAIHPKVQAASFAEFVALGRSRSKAITVGTSGNGSPGHLAVALMVQAGIPLVHVPYRGAGAALVDVVGGQIDATIVTLPATIGFIRQNQLRALAVSSSRRSRFAPELPLMSEAVPSIIVDSWQAFFAPAGTPREVIGRLNTEFSTLLKTKEIIDSFQIQAFEAGGGSPEDLGKFLRAETARWSPIIKAAGIRAD
ncbi:MAG: tripartite tricarboxylate transporter substrate binding protein [Nitrospira sp.]|nr:tripartite tricarboxylate transporter substrate binding protein [Nitrospira sp.]